MHIFPVGCVSPPSLYPLPKKQSTYKAGKTATYREILERFQPLGRPI